MNESDDEDNGGKTAMTQHPSVFNQEESIPPIACINFF